jgi:putative spermidine/putrescine transport system ATP-binding protein/spermidine/putrescine transport system ATP-binding protein
MDAIALSHLTKSFPKVGRVVDDISLNIRQGEFITLLGPSGCGKTTTLRLIAGFEFPDSGSVTVAGTDVTELPPYRRPVNTVFQDYALFPHMSVEQNVGYGMWIARVPRREISERVAAALQMVGLSEKAAARPSELSGGQKQRVALARAIVRRPKVLLLDEPLSALDAKLREAMQVELRHLHRQLGITFLLVTHDQTEAMVMSDRILIMEAGKVVQDGTPLELYDSPASPYVANFLGTSNLVPAEVLSTSAKGVLVRAGDAEFHVKSGGRLLTPAAAVTLAIRPEKAAVVPIKSAGTASSSQFAGRIIEHFFHGGMLRSAVDIGFGVPFLVDTQLSSVAMQAQQPPPGAPCTVRVDVDSIVAFPGHKAP